VSELETIALLAADVLRGGGRAVLALLAHVEGSHYRRPGARMLLAEDGRTAGAISGGCLEADLLERLPAVLARGETTAVDYDMRGPADLVWGLGLGCDGAVRILLQPLDDGRAARLQRLAAASSARRTAGCATIFRAGPGAPLGAWLVLDRGEPHGDASGAARAALEAALARALTAREPKPRRVVLDGGAEALVEVLEPAPLLLVFGTGPDVPPLVRLARAAGFGVRVLSHAPRSASASRVSELLGGRVLDIREIPTGATRTAAVLMTHAFSRDADVLRTLLAEPPQYIGILGPRPRAERLLTEAAAGRRIEPGIAARIHAPIGLDIGAETPEEIALAILAEAAAALAERDGGKLRRRPGRLHEANVELAVS